MAKPKAVPDSSSRESPAFWFRMLDASGKRRQRVNEQSARFMRWHRGNLSDLVDIRDEALHLRWQSGLENMTNLATVSSLADLFFRCPRFVVRSPYVPKRPAPPMPGMPPEPVSKSTMLFSADLARCETEMLRQSLAHAQFFEKARRSLQDALLADLGVLKVTHDAEVTVNEEDLAAAAQEANAEIDQFLKGNPKAMWAKEDQIHSVHIEIKGQLLAAAQRGETVLDSKAIKYLRDHLRMHESMKGSERPTETIRTNRVRISRVNPVTDYFYDPTVDDRTQATWRATRFLQRKADVYSNNGYDPAAIKAVRMCQDRWEPRTYMPMLTTTGSFDIPEEMVMVFEVFDLIDQKRILFADGTAIPLLVEERGELSSIQPSGPFHELTFMDDSMEGQGVPPPVAYEAEQAGATHLATSNLAAAIQGQPKTAYNKQRIDPQQAKLLWDARAGEFVGVDPRGAIDQPLDAAFFQVPAPEIDEQRLVILQRCIMGVERRSGLGTSKMGGGEQQSTATGAALGADASTSISEDRGSRVDAWSQRIARDVVRFDRRYTPKAIWVQRCGEVAIEAVPEPMVPGTGSFSVLDACNDIGVDIMPGSARRRNTAVDQKQVTDLAVAVAGLPMMQGPMGQKAVLKMVRQIAEDAGVQDPGWDDVEQEIDMMAMMAQMQPQGAPGDGDGQDPESASEDQGEAPDPTQGVSENDLQQGVQNVGGGRIATGASIGDRIRQNRSTAVARVVNRGA